MKTCETCAASFIGPMACQVCNQGDFMTRQDYTEQLNETHRQETRQKYATHALKSCELYVEGKITLEELHGNAKGIVQNMNAEILEKTGCCNG